MMNVRLALYLPSLHGGGAERVMVTLANDFAARGYMVDLMLVSSEGPYLKDVAADVRVVDLKARRVATSLYALVRYLCRERPAALLAAMGHANVIAVLARQLARVPTVGSERVHPPSFPLGRVWELVRRRTYPLLCGLVAQTKESAAWLRVHAPAPRIAVIPNPVLPVSLLQKSWQSCEGSICY